MTPALDILRDSNLEPWQKRNRLAAAAENELPDLCASPVVHRLMEEGILCSLFEGQAPYRPRYVLPDYGKLLAKGSDYLDLEPAADLFQAVNALLTAYRFVPSITGYPVYLGALDTLLEPFWESEIPGARERLLELFLVQVDRTLPDAFVHANLGPQDTRVGRAVLAIEKRLKKAVPNISLKVAPETPDTFLMEAVATALETNKPYFVNHPVLVALWGEDYGIASCYNSLRIGGGSHTLVRVNLSRLAQGCRDIPTFLEQRLPEAIGAMADLINARVRFLVEETRFFEASFLAKEGLISLDRFTSMAAVFGLHECVEQLTGGAQMGRDSEADALAHSIVFKSRDLVKAQKAVHCEGSGGRLGFHAQSGIAGDQNATPGVRVKIGAEPDLFKELKLQADLQQAFDTGVSEIALFDATAVQNPEGVLRIVRGALSMGLRILSLGSSHSELVRISGYLVKRRDLERARMHENVREETAVLGEEAVRNGRILERAVRDV
jgi:YjjI family glycine radical enzyme